MKKGLIVLLTLALLCFANMAFAATATDVPKDHWAYPAIQTLVKAGVIDGYPDGTFSNFTGLRRRWHE